VRRHAFLLLALSGLVAAGSGCTMNVDLGGGDPDGGVARGPLVLFAGPRASCILSESGRLQCFGAGGAGQLSIAPAMLHSLCGSEPCDAFPTTFALRNATSVALSDTFTCVVVAGAVWCAGSNDLGGLGRGTRDTDPHVEPLENDVTGPVVELVAGRHHACARRTNGTVACWGLGNHGALGVDPSTLSDCGMVAASEATRLTLTEGVTRRCATSPVDVPGIPNATGLRAGPFGTCVLRESGGPVCFGRSVGGSLGVGETGSEVVSTPTALAITDAVDVALGERHGCAIDALARTHCFGVNDLGQLGVGSAAPDTCDTQPCALDPVRVTDLADASVVVAGDEHTCVLLTDGLLRCFGSDALGQVGNSSGAVDDCSGVPCARTPRDVVQVGGVAQVVASGDHNLIVATNGTPMAFGGNTFRECASNNPDPVIAFPGEVYSISP
jgi:alpha-tubulin suppressor-like RCC1 family protein